MSLYLIAAIGKNNELGRNNDLVWHFKEDMKFFKETTMGHSVIMGRKTFESLPKALPGRRNIVITRSRNYTADGAEIAHSVKEALSLAGDDDAFVIGGGRIYAEMLPLCDALYLTEIDAECDEADTYFPEFNKEDYERTLIAEHKAGDISFSHILYKRKEGVTDEEV